MLEAIVDRCRQKHETISGHFVPGFGMSSTTFTVRVGTDVKSACINWPRTPVAADRFSPPASRQKALGSSMNITTSTGGGWRDVRKAMASLDHGERRGDRQAFGSAIAARSCGQGCGQRSQIIVSEPLIRSYDGSARTIAQEGDTTTEFFEKNLEYFEYCHTVGFSESSRARAQSLLMIGWRASKEPSEKRTVRRKPNETACPEFARAPALSILLTSPAFAQLKGNPDNICRNGSFPRESKDYRLAKITGAAGDRIYFHGDGNEHCPATKAVV